MQSNKKCREIHALKFPQIKTNHYKVNQERTYLHSKIIRLAKH